MRVLDHKFMRTKERINHPVVTYIRYEQGYREHRSNSRLKGISLVVLLYGRDNYRSPILHHSVNNSPSEYGENIYRRNSISIFYFHLLLCNEYIMEIINSVVTITIPNTSVNQQQLTVTLYPSFCSLSESTQLMIKFLVILVVFQKPIVNGTGNRKISIPSYVTLDPKSILTL